MPHPLTKYLWVFPGAGYAWMWKDLSRHLARETGLRPLFIMWTEEDRSFWESQHDEPLDAEIVIHCDYLRFIVDGADPATPAAEFLPRARAYEAEHNMTFMRDMVLGCRHIGRGFMFGGQGNPVSTVAIRTNHMAAVQACLKVVDYFAELAERYPPGLMLVGGGGGGVYMKPACLLARREGVPFRSLVHSRFANRYYWADSEFEESETFSRFLADFPEPSEAEIVAAEKRVCPTGISVVGFAEIKRNSRWPRILKGIVHTYARYAYGRVRGYRLTRTGYRPGSTARFLIRQRRDWHQLDRLAPTRVRDLPAHMKIVYFPLQTEPEHALNVLSPEHSNQMATAGELALSLPADALLVVKEHPYQLGRRTPGFYETLVNIPNVVLLHPDEPSLDVIRRADLVAVITGSAGYEAAVLGKPVIHFGRHGLLLDLPHVHGATGFSGMERISEILADDNPEAAAKRRRDGARYFLAMEAFALDMGRFRAPGQNDRPGREEVQVMGDALCKTLPIEARRLSA